MAKPGFAHSLALVTAALLALLMGACAVENTPVPTQTPAVPTLVPATPTRIPTPTATSVPLPIGESKLSLATGSTVGTSYPYGSAIAGVWGKHLKGVTVIAATSGGSVANARQLGARQADLAFLQSDIADYAWNGAEMFEDKIANFGVIAALYPGLVQWTVAPGVRDIADLKGRAIAVGPAASGSEANSRQILEANGLSYKDLRTALFLPDVEATAAFKVGEVEGFFMTEGVPAPAIAEAAAKVDVVMLPIAGDAARKVMDRYRLFAPATIPAGTYDGVTEDVPTLAVQSFLVARQDLDSDLVYWLTRTLMEKQPEIAQAHAMGRALSPESAVKGLTVPFHPGAERYYREIGVVR